MRSSNNRGTPVPFASFRRSLLNIRSDQIHSETSHDSNIQNLDLFERQILARFNDLSEINPDEQLLSISWIHKLLDAFLSCQEDFKVILSDNKSLLSKPPADRLATEYFDRSIKAMDIFNATRNGIETIRLWQRHLEIVVCALSNSQQRTIGEAQVNRARKALTDLALEMSQDDKDAGSVFSQRNRSFGRNKGKDQLHRVSGHSRSLSWSVSHTWSASKQLQSIASNLYPPRGNDISCTNGLAIVVFSMSFILMFVLWALVAAIPCQDRGVQIHFTIPRQFSWSGPLLSIHNQIMEEYKKRERRNTRGLLKEIHMVEKGVNQIMDLVEAVEFPMSEDLKGQVIENVREISSVCEVFKGGLDPLEQQLREVFRKVMNCRTEGLELLGNAAEP